VDLRGGRLQHLGALRHRVDQIRWLDTRHVLIATQAAAPAQARISLLDLRAGHGPRVVGETSSIVAVSPGRFAFAPTGGGVVVMASTGTRLSHHARATHLFMPYPQVGDRYAMAVPDSEALRAGRRVVVDLQDGALVLDKSFDRPPSAGIALAG
jgi:hypothetical protein